MQVNKLIKVNDQSLLEGDFSAYIKHLYLLGIVLEKEFMQGAENQLAETFPNETDKKKRFFKYIANRFTLKILCFPSKRQSLCTRLWNLQSFLMAWDDPALRKQEDKKLRQEIKFKGDIDKSFRRSIHAALIAEVNRLQNEVALFNQINFSIDTVILPVNCELSAELTKCLAECISSLKSKTPADIDQSFEKTTKAVSSFMPPADKFLHGLAIFIGLLSALACGLATGGFLFLLLSGVGAPLVVAALAGLAMFAASTYANFGLFSVHCSKFLRTLAKSGGITEVIGKEGKRTQLSMGIKCLLVLGAVLSVGVGLSSASLTLMFGMALVATLFPSLPLLLPSILISALVIGMTIGLSLVIFKAWVYLVDVMQTKFSSCKDFLDWMTEGIEEIKNFSATQLLSFLIQIAFMGFALFGLFFLCFTGIPSLAPAFTVAGSWVVGFAAFLGDLPFTVITIFDFCSGFKQLFSRADQNVTEELEEPAANLPNKKSVLGRIGDGLLLVANAAGRSMQVFDGKLISAFAAVACFFSALAGTLKKKNDHAEKSRNKASKASKDELIQFGYKTDGNTTIETIPVNLNQNPEQGFTSYRVFSAANNSFSSPISENELSQTNSVTFSHSI